MGKCLVHTVGALLINGHYGCRGAWPGQLTLCIRNKKKQINIKEAQFLFAAFLKKKLHCNPNSILCFMAAYENDSM